jgi:hypothetical protein
VFAYATCFSQSAKELDNRLKHEVRLVPGRVTSSDDPTELVFGTLLSAHVKIRFSKDAVAGDDDVDRKSRGLLPGTQHTSEGIEDPFPRACEALLSSQVRAGALLGARLILTSWVQAGKPGMPKAADGGNALPGERSTAAQSAPFSGSRNSTIFHHSVCRHAQQIKPTNRVWFQSAAAATQAGRVPCKVCKPNPTSE